MLGVPVVLIVLVVQVVLSGACEVVVPFLAF